MKVVVQRAGTSSVMVNEKCVGKIDSGLVLLVAFKETDTIDTINYMVKKIVNLRIFPDDAGIMNKSISKTKKNGVTKRDYSWARKSVKHEEDGWVKKLEKCKQLRI